MILFVLTNQLAKAQVTQTKWALGDNGFVIHFSVDSFITDTIFPFPGGGFI